MHSARKDTARLAAAAVLWHSRDLVFAMGTDWLTVRTRDGDLLLRLRGGGDLGMFVELLGAIIDREENGSGAMLGGRHLEFRLTYDNPDTEAELVLGGYAYTFDIPDAEDLFSWFVHTNQQLGAKHQHTLTEGGESLIFVPDSNRSSMRICFGREAARRLAMGLLLAAGGTRLRHDLDTPADGGALYLERSNPDHWFRLVHSPASGGEDSMYMAPSALAIAALQLLDILDLMAASGRGTADEHTRDEQE